MRISLVCVLSCGCFNLGHRMTCDEHSTNVAEDELTPAGTAIDLLVSVAGGRTVDGQLEPGDARVPITWSIEGRPGTARWIESDSMDAVSRRFGFGSGVEDIAVSCEDRLEAPVTLAMSTADGELDVAVDAVVGVRAEFGILPFVRGTGSYEDATFPERPDVDPDAFTSKQTFAQLDGLDVEDVSGSAGWETTIRSFTFVQFPAPTLQGPSGVRVDP